MFAVGQNLEAFVTARHEHCGAPGENSSSVLMKPSAAGAYRVAPHCT